MQLTHGHAVYSFEEFIASTYGAPTASAKFQRSQKRDPDYDIFTHKQHHQGFRVPIHNIFQVHVSSGHMVPHF